MRLPNKLLLCLALLLGLASLALPTGAADHFRFRQAPGGTPVLPARDLLDAAERQFLAELPELRVGLNLPDNRPYEVISDNGEISGIQIEILTHLSQSLGLRLRPVVLPSFPETLAALRNREIDLMATVGYEPSREGYMVYTLGTAPNPGAIIGRAIDTRFGDNPTLNGRRVAIERGYVAQQFVRRTFPEALITDQPDTRSALGAVALGEEDFYVGSMLMAMDRIQRDGVAGLEVKKSLLYATGQMHFGVRRDWPLLASALSKGIAALRATPLPGLQAAMQQLQGQVAAPMLGLSPAEQRQLAGRSVLRLGAVRGLELLNEATPDGGHAGIAADYTAQVAARLGVAVDMVPFDSVAQMLDALRAGQIHLVPFLTFTPARAQEVAYSHPYLEMPYFIVARSDAPLFWDLDSLRGKRLALTAQHPLRELLRQRYPDIRIVDAPPGGGAMDMVARREADAAVEVKLYANLRINHDNNGLLRTVAQVEELPAQFHFAASRESAALIPLIDRALADIPATERSRMLRRWVAVDFTPGFAWRRHAPWVLAVGAGLLLLLTASLWWTRRLAAEVRQRRTAEQRLEDVTASLPGVVFQVVLAADGQREQRYISPTAEDFLGTRISPADSVVAALSAHMRPEDAAMLRQARRDSARRQKPLKLTWRYLDPRRGERWLHCEVAVRQLGSGRSAFTGYIVDVSTERALQAQLLDAMQAKNLFVASASHELRGPLQAVTLALQRLSEGPLDAAQRQVCRIAQDSSSALTQLIDDVLDLARFEAGRLTLNPQPLDLPALLAQLVDNHRLAAESRGLRLGLTLDPQLPVRVLADGLRLRQLLVNLVGNAVKYTPQGEVHVSTRRVASADGVGERLLIAVRDTGVGIPPERQHALFEPFGMLHAPADAPPEGSSGLGLAICKRLAEAMTGHIVLTSTPGLGTTVTLDLPLPPEAPEVPAAAPTPAVATPAAAVPADAGGAGPVVLLVDDDAVSRLLLSELLRGEGLVVAEAADTASAYLRWLRGDVAAVISDQHMPDGNGLVLLQRILQEAPPAQRPRLVLCSGSPPSVEAARSAGLDAALRKPVTAEVMRELLRNMGLVGEPADKA
ncbi:transporter substrate-binding domain-containing protein [Aquabacterium sp. OR-4]|uniref:transporter substrate-binding domain-containing protein n=1 Tax=Aquabacterium sp. OR-4 TaxID=2978127 RepID=UPI0021B3C6AE|nr:transporter substrate-binding domain-containing protein [Aquabacterium sp. OR-4]MDT7833877.1 transporter substrate-binding domain-containing protein [Aquabacterium sp. OR-4]